MRFLTPRIGRVWGKVHVRLIGLCGMFFIGCALLPSQRALRQCHFEPVGFELEGANAQGLTGKLSLRAINPSRHNAKLNRLRLALTHQNDTLARITNDSASALNARDTLILPLRVVLPFAALGALAGPLAQGTRLECLLSGDALLDTPFGDYTVRNAIRKPVFVDMGKVRSDMMESLNLPWLRGFLR